PRTRRTAAEHGIDPDRLAGSGPGGRVTQADVLQAAAAAVRRPAAHPRPAATHLQAIEVDLTRVLAERHVVAPPSGAWPGLWSPTAFLAKAVLESLRGYPQLNISVDGDGRAVRHARADLGFEVETPDGSMVPVLVDAGSLSLAGLARR